MTIVENMLSRAVHLFLAIGLAVPLMGTYAAAAPVQVEGNEMESTSLSDQALSQLKEAFQLESAYVGFVGSKSENLVQLLIILEHSNAADTLQTLYKEGTLVSKMYAVIGLQLLENSGLLADLLKDARQYADQTIETYEGCVIDEVFVRDVLTRIEDQYYVEMFKVEQDRF